MPTLTAATLSVSGNRDGSGSNEAFKRFVTNVATHYGTRIKYWEVWNEHNMTGQWQGTDAQLVRMAEDARCIIAGKGRIAQGYDADLTIVDLRAKRRIENRWIASRCGWTPYDGIETMGWPVATILRGRLVMRDDRVVDPPGGQALRFLETLRPIAA